MKETVESHTYSYIMLKQIKEYGLGNVKAQAKIQLITEKTCAETVFVGLGR